MNKDFSTFSLPVGDLAHIDRQSETSLESLRGASIFITGGSGLFGTWIIESLLFSNTLRNLDLRLIILTRDLDKISKRIPSLRNSSFVQLISGDVQNFSIEDNIRISHILHLASENNLAASPSWPMQHFTSSIHGTQRILDLAARKNISKMLVTTSGAVYFGDSIRVEQRFVEGVNQISDLLSEKNIYGQSKKMIEAMSAIWAQRYGFDVKIARCFAFVGPLLPLEANYAIGNFILDALNKRDIIVNGDGTPLRSYLYLTDMVIWLLKLLSCGESGVPYNVGGEQAISIGELANLVAELSGSNIQVVIKEKPVLGREANAYLPYLERSKSLGLRQTIDLSDAIVKTIEWYKQKIL